MTRFPLARFVAVFALSALAPSGCLDDPEDLTDEVHEPSPCGDYELGESWEPDACNGCTCTESGPLCTDVECEGAPPDLEGRRAAPVCDGHEFGEIWMIDECNACWCTARGMVCTRKKCLPGCRDEGPECTDVRER